MTSIGVIIIRIVNSSSVINITINKKCFNILFTCTPYFL